MASIVIVYLKDRSTYVTEIMNTIYPGSRVSTGGYSLYKMFEYVATIFYPFKATLNNSEFSMMVTLFPLPMVMAVYRRVRIFFLISCLDCHVYIQYIVQLASH